MSTIKTLYGTEKQSITVTLASLGNGNARSSAVVDNTSNLFLEALVQIQIKSASSSTSTTGVVAIYAYGTVDAADSLYPEGAGTDTGVTLVSPTNLKLIGSLNVVANSTTYISDPMSVSAAFGGVLPSHWGIVVLNNTGAALDSTEGNHLKYYQGVQAQVV